MLRLHTPSRIRCHKGLLCSPCSLGLVLVAVTPVAFGVVSPARAVAQCFEGFARRPAASLESEEPLGCSLGR